MGPRRDRPGQSRAAELPAPTSAETRSRPGGRSARVREAVLRATLSLLTEKGFDGFSIAEVASRAGVHETSIYRRWKTKNVLALEASLHFARSALPIPDTGSLRSDLVAVVKRLLSVMLSPEGQTVLALGVSQHPHVVAARRDFWRWRNDALRPIFDRALERGEFPRDADPARFFETLVAPLYMRQFATGEPLEDWPYEEAIDRLLTAYTA
jgi:AcrR family transcriptional regulator